MKTTLSMIGILNRLSTNMAFNLDYALNDYQIEDIKEFVSNINAEIIEDYEAENANKPFGEYFANTVKRYTAKFDEVDGSIYFAGVTAKNVIPPLTKSAKKAFTKFAENCKEYSNREAVAKFNDMTGLSESNTYWTRLIKKGIYASVKVNLKDNTTDVKARVNNAVKMIPNIIYSIVHLCTLDKIDDFISLDNVEDICNNPVETKIE